MVAIIAILAAIAVPNFLEAQTRAKVSRGKSDLRTMATALESYAVDSNNRYPFDKVQADGMTPRPQNAFSWYICNVITTPVAYIGNNLLVDPFRAAIPGNPYTNRFRYIAYGLAEFNQEQGNITAAQADWYREMQPVFGLWRLTSSGPDRNAGPAMPGSDFLKQVVIYDATNGTVSVGDIIRSQNKSDHTSY